MRSVSYVYLPEGRSLVIRGGGFRVRVDGSGEIDVKYGLERGFSRVEASPSRDEKGMEVNGKDG